MGEQALDRTQDHALDVVGDNTRRGGEGCIVFESLNLGFQFCAERGALAENSSLRGIWYGDGGSRLWVGL